MTMENKPEMRFSVFNEDWKLCKLGDITSSYSGGTPQVGRSEYYNGEIPFIRSGEINSEETELSITRIGLDNSSSKLVRKGDILYALYGATSGEVSRSKIEGAINQAVLAILPHENYDANFIVQWLITNKNKIISTYLQGGQGNLSGEIVKSLILYTPSYQEQVKIGQYFEFLDNTITLQQRKLEILKNQKKAFLEKMFPKEGENVPEIRFSGFSDAWKQRKFEDWGTFYYGKSCPKWSIDENAKTPCVRYGELYTKFGNKIDKVFSYTNIEPENLRFSTGKEVLIPRVGEDPFDYNHCTWLSIKGIAIGEMISVFNTDQDPQFSATMFNATLKNEFAKRVEGGSVTNLYFEKLKNILIYYPSLEEQKKIASFFERIDQTITLQQRKLEILKNIKKSFLQKMFV